MRKNGSVCAVCDSGRNHLFITHDGMDLLECEECGFVFMAELPSASEIEKLYTDDSGSGTIAYSEKVATKMRRLRRRARKFSRYAPGGGYFLDVGANVGFMTEAMRERGFICHGVEPDPHSVSYAREHYPGNTYHRTIMENYEPGDMKFDLVYCSEVIEHSADVNGLAAAIHRVMKPGAALYLTTPDIKHWRRPRDVTKWIGFCPPAHCVYFNPGALARLLDKHGFTIVRRRLAFKPGIKVIARKT